MDSQDKKRLEAIVKYECKPMPQERELLDFSLQYNKEETEKIQEGLVPHQMEDHWIVYSENNKIYIYRSHTGFCIFSADILEEDENKFKITNIYVNALKDQWGGDKETNQQTISDLLNNLASGK